MRRLAAILTLLFLGLYLPVAAGPLHLCLQAGSFACVHEDGCCGTEIADVCCDDDEAPDPLGIPCPNCDGCVLLPGLPDGQDPGTAKVKLPATPVTPLDPPGWALPAPLEFAAIEAAPPLRTPPPPPPSRARLSVWRL